MHGIHDRINITMAPKRIYKEREAVPESVKAALHAYTPLTQQLLHNRGIQTAQSAEVFLNPNYVDHLHDPFLLTDMEHAVDRILLAMRNNERIGIYSDYDCDGIPGGVLLHDFFEAIAYEHFENYIPHRHHEGYGFNVDAASSLGERGVSLIITVDCGIVDHEAALKSKELGIDVIITDHHEPSETLPDAYAVINPKRDSAYPFDGICGTGVAYKLVQALLIKGKADGTITLKDGMEKWWLDMVGLATVADMVPLVGENRVFAHYGLQVLRKSRRPGLQQLLRKAGGSQRHITEDDIGFTIGPRINAASRMDTPEDAFNMLRTKDEAEAGEYVRHLEKLNNERKGVVAGMTKEVKKRMSAMPELPPVIVMGNPEWRPSLVGLVANSLVDEFKRPVFLWGRDGKETIKGSCRSDGIISTQKLMEATPDSFIAFGGHHGSGGFSVEDEKIHTLVDSLNDAYTSLGDTVLLNEFVSDIDAVITLTDIDTEFMRTLTKLAPYGEGNPKPLFRINDVMPSAVDIFGKTKNHTKLRFGVQSLVREAIAFFKTPDQFDCMPEVGKTYSLIAHVEDSYFMGRKQTRLRIVDIV
jgi:single-stranded-DNA-specific exonuclease